MNSKFKYVILLFMIILSMGLALSFRVNTLFQESYYTTEKVTKTILKTVIDEKEIVSVKETIMKDKNKNFKNLDINLNLKNTTKTIAMDTAMLKVTQIINVLEDNFSNEVINDYKFIINTTQHDIYGNEQKIKILEIYVPRDTIRKIKFENFDYRNLEQIAQVKKFNFLKEDDLKEDSK